MKCKNCGQELSENSKFCGTCGNKVEPPAVNQQPPQQQQQQQQPQQQQQYQQYQQPYQYQPQAVSPAVPPLSVFDYILMAIVFGIPIVGFIMLFVWGFGSDVNKNRQNYARAQLIIMVVVFVLSIFLTVLFSSLLGGLSNIFDPTFYNNYL